MKFAVSLLLTLAFVSTLTGCDTLNTRRRFYSPKYVPGPNEGYWTHKYHKMRKQEGVFGVSKPTHEHEYSAEGGSEYRGGIFGWSWSEPR